MDHKEMARIAGDPVAIRSTAAFVLASIGPWLTDRERDFVSQLRAFDGKEPLSMRQREWLHDLRSRSSRRSNVQGFRASALVEKLWQLRFDLSEESEEFVARLREQASDFGADLTLSNGQWRHVFALCHQVGLIERYVGL